MGDLALVTELWLRRNDLTGTIPAELGGMTGLRRLYLDGNRLTGGIPVRLANLASIERLWLQDNELSGEITFELGRLAELEQIFLGGTNSLSGCIPTEWESLDILADDLDTLGLEFCTAS